MENLALLGLFMQFFPVCNVCCPCQMLFIIIPNTDHWNPPQNVIWDRWNLLLVWLNHGVWLSSCFSIGLKLTAWFFVVCIRWQKRCQPAGKLTFMTIPRKPAKNWEWDFSLRNSKIFLPRNWIRNEQRSYTTILYVININWRRSLNPGNVDILNPTRVWH